MKSKSFFSKNSNQSILSERGTIIVPLDDLVISTNYGPIKGAYLVGRLLNYTELVRIINAKEKGGASLLEVEEAIFDSCIYYFFGMDDVEVDMEDSDAGIVSRVVELILDKTKGILRDIEIEVSKKEEDVSIIEKMSAIISRMLNIPFLEVEKMPINKIVRLFSIAKASFPNEVVFGDKESES